MNNQKKNTGSTDSNLSSLRQLNYILLLTENSTTTGQVNWLLPSRSSRTPREIWMLIICIVQLINIVYINTQQNYNTRVRLLTIEGCCAVQSLTVPLEQGPLQLVGSYSSKAFSVLTAHTSLLCQAPSLQSTLESLNKRVDIHVVKQGL